MTTSKPNRPLTSARRAAALLAAIDGPGDRLADVLAAAACDVCQAYVARRGDLLLMWVAIYAHRQGVDPRVLFSSYLGRVHRRHFDGGCLSTRVRTPDKKLPDGGTRIHVSRSCNGCQADLGDVREDELDAAVSGAPLPDVRIECGCHGRGKAA